MTVLSNLCAAMATGYLLSTRKQIVDKQSKVAVNVILSISSVFSVVYLLILKETTTTSCYVAVFQKITVRS